jgi:hypothetical protein
MKAIPKYKHDHSRILELSDSGLKQHEIAMRLRCSLSTVNRTIRLRHVDKPVISEWEYLVKSFDERIVPEPNTGCWLWTADLYNNGYGRFFTHKFRGRKHSLAHRFSYLRFKGEFDESLMVMHKCDTRACVNPDHLTLGTALDNQHDKLRKGRSYNQLKTHCKHGHEFTPENTKINNRGNRECKTCAYLSVKRYTSENREKVREQARINYWKRKNKS